MKPTYKGLLASSFLLLSGIAVADDGYTNGLPFRDHDEQVVSIQSVTDDGAGNLTVTLTDGTQSSHSIPVSQSFNYRDYNSDASEKVFQVSGSAVDGSIVGNLVYDTEVRRYDRTQPGIVSYSRDRKLGGINGSGVNYSVITLDKSTDKLLLSKFQRYSNNGLTLKETRTMTPGVVFRTENMQIGKTFGSYSSLDSTKAGLSSVIQSVTLLGLDDVTVPAGSFTGCLKLLRHRNSERLGGVYDRINWFCPDNVGLVKSVTMAPSTTVVELMSVTP